VRSPIAFFDGGSTVSLIRNRFAQEMGLVGESVTYYLKVVDGEYVERKSSVYQFRGGIHNSRCLPPRRPSPHHSLLTPR
jgi:hypothetical protein